MNAKGDANRSVRMTKRRLCDALIALLAQKPVREITVRELTALAKVSRGTFYFHYTDIYDLLAQIEQDQLEGLDALMGAILPSMAPPEALLTLFVYLNEHEALCGALMGQNGDAAFVRRICDLLEKRVIGHFVEPGQETPRQRYLTSFAVNGCVGSIEAWLQNGRTQSPEEMSAMTWDAVRAIWAAASGASE